MENENEDEIEAQPFILVAQINKLKYDNSRLFYENDGLKNELRIKKEEITSLQEQVHRLTTKNQQNATSIL